MAWNLGFSDFVTTTKWLKKLNYVNIKSPILTNKEKRYTMAYRGKSSSKQRGMLVNFLKSKQIDSSYIMGSIVSHRNIYFILISSIVKVV